MSELSPNGGWPRRMKRWRPPPNPEKEELRNENDQ